MNQCHGDIYIFKVIMLGDVGVGKTSIISRFTNETNLSRDSRQTVGSSMRTKEIIIDGKRVRLQIWDTAGQERFRSLHRGFYKGASGIMLAYDVTSPKSLDQARIWLGEVEDNADQGVCKLLVGNKCDLYQENKVSFDAAQAFASEFGIDTMEVSALTSENIIAAFKLLLRKMITQKDEDDRKEVIKEKALNAIRLLQYRKKKRWLCFKGW